MKKKYSLFIGRYQPFHKGHAKLIRTVLNEGKNVCIAIRDTSIDFSNPYNMLFRKKLIQEEFYNEIYEKRVKIIVIPDIEEVCYGRKVGWGIREIRLDKKTESISATKLRRKKKK